MTEPINVGPETGDGRKFYLHFSNEAGVYHRALKVGVPHSHPKSGAAYDTLEEARAAISGQSYLHGRGKVAIVEELVTVLEVYELEVLVKPIEVVT